MIVGYMFLNVSLFHDMAVYCLEYFKNQCTSSSNKEW